MMRRGLALVLFMVLASGLVAAQQEGAAEEPPQWAQDLRRAEIVATGSLPLTLLASRLIYSLVRFTVKSIQAGALDVNYAPWFLAPPGAPQLAFVERLGILGGAVSLSTVIAVIDFRLGRAEEIENE